VPRYVRFVDEFPMTVTGKVQKYKMREEAVQVLGRRLRRDVGASPLAARSSTSAGHRRVPDGALRDGLTAAGLSDVRTLPGERATRPQIRPLARRPSSARAAGGPRRMGVDNALPRADRGQLRPRRRRQPLPERARRRATHLHALFLSAEPEVVPDTSQ
jgi:hypothetical protein